MANFAYLVINLILVYMYGFLFKSTTVPLSHSAFDLSVLVAFHGHTQLFFFAKHGLHIGIMTPSASLVSSVSSGRNTFGFQVIAFEEMHQFHSKFTKGKSSLNIGHVRK